MEQSANEQRSVGVALSNTPGMMQLLNLSDDNVNVTDTTIEGIPALQLAVDLIASSVAKLDTVVTEVMKKGPALQLPRHHANILINVAPNDEQTPYNFKYAIVANAILSGGGGAEIIRNDNGKPISLRLMRHGCTPYKINTYDPLRYWDNETGKIFDPEDVLFLPGIFIRDGYSAKPLALVFKNVFGEALGQTLLANTLFKQGVYPSAVYSYTGTKTSAKGDEATAVDISRYFGGLEKAGMVIPIPNMDKFTPIPRVSFVDSQMIESRKFTIADVARITGVPADMLGETDKQSYSFSEMSAKRFLLYCIDPWLTKFQQEMQAKLLYSYELGKIRIEFQVDETIWMLPKDRAEYWNKLFQMGAKSPNEIRAYNNETPIEGGDEYYVQSQLIPISIIKAFWTSKNATNGGTQPT